LDSNGQGRDQDFSLGPRLDYHAAIGGKTPVPPPTPLRTPVLTAAQVSRIGEQAQTLVFTKNT